MHHLQLAVALKCAQGTPEANTEADIEEACAERRHAQQRLSEHGEEALALLGEVVEESEALNQEQKESGDGEQGHRFGPEKAQQISA